MKELSQDRQPRGMVRRGDSVAIRPTLFSAVHAWVIVALCLAIAVIIPIETAQRAADGKLGVDMATVYGVSAAFAVIAGAMVRLAVRLSRPGYVIDADGIKKVTGRKAFLRWDDVSIIELKSNGRFWQIWVHAPGGVHIAKRDTAADRLILPCKVLAPHREDVHSYLLRSWQGGRSGDPAPAPRRPFILPSSPLHCLAA